MNSRLLKKKTAETKTWGDVVAMIMVALIGLWNLSLLFYNTHGNGHLDSTTTRVSASP